MVVIDTDILIWILRGNKDIKVKFVKVIDMTNGNLFITPIQIAEIYSGIRDKERIETELFLSSFRNIDIDNKIGKIAGEYLNKYNKSHNITISDALIAACSKINSYLLWTLNIKHYPMIKDNELLVLKE